MNVEQSMKLRTLGNETLSELLTSLYLKNRLRKQEIVKLLTELDNDYRELLFELASAKREKHYGKRVYVRGLLEISNICKQECLYCGIRAANRHAARYRMTTDQILRSCESAYEAGIRSFVFQSGEDAFFNEERLTSLVKTVKRAFPDAALTLSMGEMAEGMYEGLRRAGADRYLLRHETASAHLYEMLHPSMSFRNRVRCLRMLKRLGFQTGAGFMVGLPGQGPEELAMDLLFLKAFYPDMVGVGPFIPHRYTPLRHAAGGTLNDSLTMVALARLFVPTGMIPATNAMATLDPEGRTKALKAGANVVMVNVGPAETRRKYELYERIWSTKNPDLRAMDAAIRAAGLEPSYVRGDHVRRDDGG